jgi:hypothetical protein
MGGASVQRRAFTRDLEEKRWSPISNVVTNLAGVGEQRASADRFTERSTECAGKPCIEKGCAGERQL